MRDPASGPSIRLRPLLPGDVDRVVEIAALAFQSEGVAAEVRSTLELYVKRGLVGVPLNQQADEALPREYFAILRDEAAAELVAGITGLYLLGTWPWPGNLWLGWTAVDPAFQGHGVGSAALQAVMRVARSRGAERLKVETESGGRATGFYLHNGFAVEATLTAHYGRGADATILSRSLLESQI